MVSAIQKLKNTFVARPYFFVVRPVFPKIHQKIIARPKNPQTVSPVLICDPTNGV